MTHDFRTRLAAFETLHGTFVKEVSAHTIEVLGLAGFDFVVLDAEHAPFDRHSLDLGVLACRAAGLHCVIRVRENSAPEIMNALDLGAEAVIVPHVSSAADARTAVSFARHSGSRGFTNSSRAGNYGAKTLWQHVDDADRHVALIVMIEDPVAAEHSAQIAAVPGVDAVLVGRNDLAVSLDDRQGDATHQTAGNVINTCRSAEMPVMLFVANAAEAREFASQGVTAAIIGSDLGMLRQAATAIVGDAKRSSPDPVR